MTQLATLIIPLLLIGKAHTNDIPELTSKTTLQEDHIQSTVEVLPNDERNRIFDDTFSVNESNTDSELVPGAQYVSTTQKIPNQSSRIFESFNFPSVTSERTYSFHSTSMEIVDAIVGEEIEVTYQSSTSVIDSIKDSSNDSSDFTTESYNERDDSDTSFNASNSRITVFTPATTTSLIAEKEREVTSLMFTDITKASETATLKVEMSIMDVPVTSTVSMNSTKTQTHEEHKHNDSLFPSNEDMENFKDKLVTVFNQNFIDYTTNNSDQININDNLKGEVVTAQLLSNDTFENNDSVIFESSETTSLDSNSTRVPKRIQESLSRFQEGRSRPSHPDPSFSHPKDSETSRHYHADSSFFQRPFFRPTPDHRTSVIRQDQDYTRPAKPDPDYQRTHHGSEYASSRPIPNDSESSKQSLPDSTGSKPHRSSLSRPHRPLGTFGRPYRPDYHKPHDITSIRSRPSESFTQESFSQQIPDINDHSRADYDYTRQSESSSEFHQSNTKPYSEIAQDTSSETKQTHYDFSANGKRQTSASLAGAVSTDYQPANKPVKTDTFPSNRPHGHYPKPSFGNNYDHTVETPYSMETSEAYMNLTKVESIKANCFDNHMKVIVRFNGTFSGLIYSSGYAHDSSCSYVNGSGRSHYEFFIRLNRCGTLGQQEVAQQRGSLASRVRQERAQYLVNTVTVQYNPLIEEDVDEHFRVTCEYGYDFWKTVTFPVLGVESSDVKIRNGNPVVFTLPPPQCHMEIRAGYGSSGARVSGPVNVGDPLTLLIHMKSESVGFDILVSNCHAHNGAQTRLQLIDANGCVVQKKLINPFRGINSPDRAQQLTLYSYLKAFRFTGSPALYIECDVHMCHGSCPPQRCYWRRLQKRAARNTSGQHEAAQFVSQSLSLFQSLEVRHEEADHNESELDGREQPCTPCGVLLACLLMLLVISSSVSICLCKRLRRVTLKGAIEKNLS